MSEFRGTSSAPATQHSCHLICQVEMGFQSLVLHCPTRGAHSPSCHASMCTRIVCHVYVHVGWRDRCARDTSTDFRIFIFFWFDLRTRSEQALNENEGREPYSYTTKKQGNQM